jgi:hypothetical protein
MWLLFWFLVFVVGACLIFLMPALWGREIYKLYRGSRAVMCPATHRQVAVSFDAFHAALSGLRGKFDLRLAGCTLWPARVHCGQECIPEARRTASYTQGEVEQPKTKKIYNVPVLIAAFAAWVFGAVWHSQYLFRTHWREAFALSRPELRQMVWWWSLICSVWQFVSCLPTAWSGSLCVVDGEGYGRESLPRFFSGPRSRQPVGFSQAGLESPETCCELRSLTHSWQALSSEQSWAD